MHGKHGLRTPVNGSLRTQAFVQGAKLSSKARVRVGAVLDQRSRVILRARWPAAPSQALGWARRGSSPCVRGLAAGRRPSPGRRGRRALRRPGARAGARRGRSRPRDDRSASTRATADPLRPQRARPTPKHQHAGRRAGSPSSPVTPRATRSTRARSAGGAAASSATALAVARGRSRPPAGEARSDDAPAGARRRPRAGRCRRRRRRSAAPAACTAATATCSRTVIRRPCGKVALDAHVADDRVRPDRGAQRRPCGRAASSCRAAAGSQRAADRGLPPARDAPLTTTLSTATSEESRSHNQPPASPATASATATPCAATGAAGERAARAGRLRRAAHPSAVDAASPARRRAGATALESGRGAAAYRRRSRDRLRAALGERRSARGRGLRRAGDLDPRLERLDAQALAGGRPARLELGRWRPSEPSGAALPGPRSRARPRPPGGAPAARPRRAEPQHRAADGAARRAGPGGDPRFGS